MSKKAAIPVDLTFKPSDPKRSSRSKPAAPNADGLVLTDDPIEEFSSTPTSEPPIGFAVSGVPTHSASSSAAGQATDLSPAKDLSTTAFQALQDKLAEQVARNQKLREFAELRTKIAAEEADFIALLAAQASPPALAPGITTSPTTVTHQDVSDMIASAVQAALSSKTLAAKTKKPSAPPSQGKSDASSTDSTAIARQLKSAADPSADSDSDDVSVVTSSSRNSQAATAVANKKLEHRHAVAIATRQEINDAFEEMFRSKSSLGVQTIAAYLLSGSAEKGLPFIAATGEYYVEYFDNVSAKNRDLCHALEKVCGPPGSEAPAARQYGTAAITIGTAVRNFEELDCHFRQQLKALSNPASGLLTDIAMERTHHITNYSETLVPYMRNQMGMSIFEDLGSRTSAYRCQWSDFAILMTAHYTHWHQCMLHGDLSKLVEDFDKSFDPVQKLLSSSSKRLPPGLIWTDVATYLGLRCHLCRYIGMSEEFCTKCSTPRYPWVKQSIMPVVSPEVRDS